MSVNKEDNGTFTVRWYERNAMTGEQIRRSKRGFRTKKEARKFEEAMQDNSGFIIFRDLMELYLKSEIGFANDETIRAKRNLLKKYASEFLDRDIRRIKRSDLLEWRIRVASLDLCTFRKNRLIQNVKAVSKFGMTYYDYPDFAVCLKSFPKSSDDVHEIHIISPEDFDRLMEKIPNEVYKKFFIYLYHTGLRRGEAMALTKSDIEGNRANINKSIRSMNKGLNRLKNPQSRRSILLDETAMETIKPLMKEEGDFVFGGIECLKCTSMRRYLDQAAAAAELPHCRVHDFRHSFISNAILNGMDIVTVSKYVGHSNIEMTLNRYSHLLKDSEQKMIEKMNEIYKKS